ncbi:hypothetical protein [Marinobacter persicus]|uniref:Calcineurin-like phosphoesterase family protein n=1 Tax=Marinobacter persicus TaxID=930118 RepID=A0A2S6GAH4_9GAMM|nr:hypothetical protein [Marinobacter persicus]KXS53511.1 MAG: hypothetical protein AWU57_2100 [Marinobacter sp. T13-3]PPK53316.1 hypothetical protein BY455_102117 [Marinobacter persicus]PPK56153.1 hypothetical protein B0H24_1002117 [Marinobacter persicus]PPK59748.1 hypothetical protein BY454_102117 [Marinobacter persicus]
MPKSKSAMTEGRSCPLAYRYRPEVLCQDPEPVNEDVLYVVGGLYGNLEALDEIERMAAAEERLGRRVRLVFNGDFNWFNADDALFRAINQRVLAHTASLGNVEYELAIPSDGAGCGCAYPDFVDQGVVERSNRIMVRLQATAENHGDILNRLATLPRYRCLIFGGLKILVLHGDPESLAGWGLSREYLSSGKQGPVSEWFDRTGADVMACTHTCLPAIWHGRSGGRTTVVLNNGAAGMGNLAGDPRGLITRIAREKLHMTPLASHGMAGMELSLLPVHFDVEAWLSCFDRIWPPGSEAAVSYRDRLTAGTGVPANQLIFPA